MILFAFSVVALSLAGLIVLHVGFLGCTRSLRRPAASRASAALLAMGIPAGSGMVWVGLEQVPLSLRIGALCLFLAGWIVYLELRSLLSRGYSLRILADLGRHQGSVSVGRLVAGYGNGIGLEGLLRRRLSSLAAWRLLQVAGDRVGPLTPLGRLCASLGAGLRKMLRLELVG